MKKNNWDESQQVVLGVVYLVMYMTSRLVSFPAQSDDSHLKVRLYEITSRDGVVPMKRRNE